MRNESAVAAGAAAAGGNSSQRKMRFPTAGSRFLCSLHCQSRKSGSGSVPDAAAPNGPKVVLSLRNNLAHEGTHLHSPFYDGGRVDGCMGTWLDVQMAKWIAGGMRPMRLMRHQWPCTGWSLQPPSQPRQRAVWGAGNATKTKR
ncbi:GD16442 [Drosophila simulans]|uniref:GD16442 n=1 Tax=Drosophila simulans TaxID=7240 RepID=B4R2L2_DROSI|nr:GD16442 [Drosophila simulans]